MRKPLVAKITEPKKQFALYLEPEVYNKLAKKMRQTSHAGMVVTILQEVMGPDFTKSFDGLWPTKFRKPHNIKPKNNVTPSRVRMLGVTAWLAAPIINKAIGISRDRGATLQRLMRDHAYKMAKETPPALLKRGPKPRPAKVDPSGVAGLALAKTSKKPKSTSAEKAESGKNPKNQKNPKSAKVHRAVELSKVKRNSSQKTSELSGLPA